MQFFKPENYVEVRRALLKAGRSDLIGSGCDALIPSKPPREAVARRREQANAQSTGEYVHTVPGVERGRPSKRQSRHESGSGYRPNRTNAKTPRTPR
jgi:hypothetical protein